MTDDEIQAKLQLRRKLIALNGINCPEAKAIWDEIAAEEAARSNRESE